MLNQISQQTNPHLLPTDDEIQNSYTNSKVARDLLFGHFALIDGDKVERIKEAYKIKIDPMMNRPTASTKDKDTYAKLNAELKGKMAKAKDKRFFLIY